MEPRGTARSLGRFQRGLADRLPEMSDEELPGLQNALAEGGQRLRVTAFRAGDGLTRAAAEASAGSLAEAGQSLARETRLRQTAAFTPEKAAAETPKEETKDAEVKEEETKPVEQRQGAGPTTSPHPESASAPDKAEEESPRPSPHPEAVAVQGEEQADADQQPPLPKEKPETEALRAEQRALLEKHASEEGLSEAERSRLFFEIPQTLSEKLQERFQAKDPAVLEALEDADLREDVEEGALAVAERSWEQADSTAFEPRIETFTPGAVRVDIVNPGLHLDGLNYTIQWSPLDANGEILPQVSTPESVVEEKGGHAIPLLPTPQVIEPPFDNPHGWSVRIVVPPQAAKSGNSAQPYLNIYKEK